MGCSTATQEPRQFPGKLWGSGLPRPSGELARLGEAVEAQPEPRLDAGGHPRGTSAGLRLPRHAQCLPSEPVLNLRLGRDAHLDHAFLQKRGASVPLRPTPGPAHKHLLPCLLACDAKLTSSHQHKTQLLSASGLCSTDSLSLLPATPQGSPHACPTPAGPPSPPVPTYPESLPACTQALEKWQGSDRAGPPGQGSSRPTCPQPPGRGAHLQRGHLQLRVHGGQPGLALLSSHVVEEASPLSQHVRELQLRTPALSFHPGTREPLPGHPAAQAPNPTCAPGSQPEHPESAWVRPEPRHRHVSEGTFTSCPQCPAFVPTLWVLTLTRNCGLPSAVSLIAEKPSSLALPVRSHRKSHQALRAGGTLSPESVPLQLGHVSATCRRLQAAGGAHTFYGLPTTPGPETPRKH